ncbi:hypothetical protein GN956_G8777 [Arapaima gigas]
MNKPMVEQHIHSRSYHKSQSAASTLLHLASSSALAICLTQLGCSLGGCLPGTITTEGLSGSQGTCCNDERGATWPVLLCE